MRRLLLETLVGTYDDDPLTNRAPNLRRINNLNEVGRCRRVKNKKMHRIKVIAIKSQLCTRIQIDNYGSNRN